MAFIQLLALAILIGCRRDGLKWQGISEIGANANSFICLVIDNEPLYKCFKIGHILYSYSFCLDYIFFQP